MLHPTNENVCLQLVVSHSVWLSQACNTSKGSSLYWACWYEQYVFHNTNQFKFKILV